MQRAAGRGVEEQRVTAAIAESETTQISKGNLKGVVVSSVHVRKQNTFENQISVQPGADAITAPETLGFFILRSATP